MYRSSSIAKGMPIGLSLVGRTSCSHRNGIIPSGMLRFPPRHPGGKAHRKSLGGDLQAKQTTMASHHSTAQLERGIAAQIPSAQRRETSIAPRIICGRNSLPWAATPAVVLAADKLRTLLPASFLFIAVDIVAGPAHGLGPGACPVGRVLSMELAIDLRSPDLLVQDSLNSGAAVFDVTAWLEPVRTTKGML